MKKRYIFEADDDEAFDAANSGGDNADEGGESDSGNEDSGDDSSNDNTEDNADEGNDDNQDDSNEEDNNDEESDDEDFTIQEPEEDSGDDSGDTSDDGGDDSGDDDSSDDSSNEEEKVTDTPTKKAERELFSSLTPEEQAIKNKMLKKLFVELYSNCDALISKFNDISAELEEVSPQIKRVLGLLFNLKQMIDDYLMNIYKTKSYIENDIMFNRYLSILNTTKNIVTDLDKMYDDPKN